jgi:hypothetical protein
MLVRIDLVDTGRHDRNSGPTSRQSAFMGLTINTARKPADGDYTRQSQITTQRIRCERAIPGWSPATNNRNPWARK